MVRRPCLKIKVYFTPSFVSKLFIFVFVTLIRKNYIYVKNQMGVPRYGECSHSGECDYGGDVCCNWNGKSMCLMRYYADDGGDICPPGMSSENTGTVKTCPKEPHSKTLTESFNDTLNYNKSGVIPGGKLLQDHFADIEYPGVEGCNWTVPLGKRCVNSNNCEGAGVCCEDEKGVRTCQERRSVTYKDGSSAYLCPCGFEKQHCGGSTCPKDINYRCAPSTCVDCKFEGDTLSCKKCMNRDKIPVNTDNLDISGCEEDVYNCDGKLTCGSCSGGGGNIAGELVSNFDLNEFGW